MRGVQLKEASCGQCALSLEGDVQLPLDDGTVLRAHRLYLEHASAVLKASLHTANPNIEEGSGASRPAANKCPGQGSAADLKLPLPAVTRRQAQLLVHALYCFTRETWASSLGPPELIDLARIAEHLGCKQVLSLVDTVMVVKCSAEADRPGSALDTPGTWLTVQDAPAQHQLARKLQLAEYEALVGRFLGRHAYDVDLTRLDPSFAAVLQGACLMQK